MNQIDAHAVNSANGSYPPPGATLPVVDDSTAVDGKMRHDIYVKIRAAQRLTDWKRFEQADFLFKELEQEVPNNIHVKTFRAQYYARQGDLVAAVDQLGSILQLVPDHSQTYVNLASMLLKRNEYKTAQNILKMAYALDPENLSALIQYAHNGRFLADWDGLEEVDKRKEGFHDAGTKKEPGLFLTIFDDPAVQRKISERYARERFSHIKQDRPKTRKRSEGDRIRIGYFSSDIRLHATMYLIQRMFELHDRERFEIIIYSYHEEFDEFSQRAKDCVDKYHQCHDMSDDEIIALARKDGLDIAVDLKGYTCEERASLVFQNPAPVNVSYIGFPSTLGYSGLDYIVADDVMIPEHLRQHYTEKVLYLPDCYQATDNTRPIPNTANASRSSQGLPENAFVFANFSSHYKISPQEYDVWMRLLNKVENSVLWLWCHAEDARENFKLEAEKRGVSRDRIIFAESADHPQHMERIGLADLFVDTFACCAHTTASDALWAGLPLVALEGQQFAARVSTSILNAMEVPELVAKTTEEYEAIALDLALNPEKLHALREKVKAKRLTAPLYDTERFTRNWEALLVKALERAEQGLEPDYITLN